MTDKERVRKLQLFTMTVQVNAKAILERYFATEDVFLTFINYMNVETRNPVLNYKGRIEDIELDYVDISNMYIAYEFCILNEIKTFGEALEKVAAITLVSEFQEQYLNAWGKTSIDMGEELHEFKLVIQNAVKKNLKNYLKIDDIQVRFDFFEDDATGKTRLIYDARIQDRLIEEIDVTDLYMAYKFCHNYGFEELEQDVLRATLITLVTVFQGEYLYPLKEI